MEKDLNLNENRLSFLRKVFYFLGFTLFSMMIVTPSAFQYLKMILLMFIFFGVFIDLISNKRKRLHPVILGIFIFYIFLGLSFGIYGLLQQNLGALPITKETVLYVIFYMFMICTIIDYKSVKYVHFTLVFSMCFLAIYQITSVLNGFGIWPDWLYLNLETETSVDGVGISAFKAYGRLSATFSSLPGWLFLQPYYFTYLILSPKKKSKFSWFLFGLVTLIMIFIGRRMLMITSFVFPVLILLVLKSIRNDKVVINFNMKKIIFYFFLTVFCFGYILIEKTGINLQSSIDYFFYTFQSVQKTADGSLQSNVRLESIYHLFQGWKESPLFGFGNGASYDQYVRSKSEPWNYEVLYMQFLYSWGIIGFFLYFLGIYFIINQLIKIYKKNSIYSIYAMSTLMGMLSFLIGSSTNPYLLKFDFLYVIFLPVAIINLSYLKR